MSERGLKTEDDLRHEFRREIERYDSDAEAARAYGVSASYICQVLSGKKPITVKLALGLGYERQYRFVRYEERR